jgi:hypothetical protein
MPFLRSIMCTGLHTELTRRAWLGQLALLDKLVGDKLRACAVLIQKNLYMRVIRRRYRRLRASALIAQRRTWSRARGPQTTTLTTTATARLRVCVRVCVCVCV